MTHAQLIRVVRALGLSIRRTEHGEWRINLRGGTEDTAYYTDNAEDALNTARMICPRCGDHKP